MTDIADGFRATRQSIRDKTAELLGIRVDHNGNRLPDPPPAEPIDATPTTPNAR